MGAEAALPDGNANPNRNRFAAKADGNEHACSNVYDHKYADGNVHGYRNTNHHHDGYNNAQSDRNGHGYSFGS